MPGDFWFGIMICLLGVVGLWLVGFHWQWALEASRSRPAPGSSGRTEHWLVRTAGENGARVINAVLAFALAGGGAYFAWENRQPQNGSPEGMSSVRTRMGDLMWDRTVTAAEGKKLGRLIDEEYATLGIAGSQVGPPMELTWNGFAFELRVPGFGGEPTTGSPWWKRLADKAERVVFNNRPVVVLSYDPRQSR